MAIHVGVGGVVKNVASAKCGVSGTVKSITHGYNGVAGVRRQFFGQQTGIQYFLAVPTNIFVGEGSSTSNLRNSAYTFTGSTTSGSYTIYKYRIDSDSASAYYVELWFYKYNSRSYPKTYYADYIYYRVTPKDTSTTHTGTRGYTANWHIWAIYDNETFANLEDSSVSSPKTSRTAELQNYRTDGLFPSTFSLNMTVTYAANNDNFRLSNPIFYSAQATNGHSNGEVVTYTTNNTTSTGTTSEPYRLRIGQFIEAKYYNVVYTTVKFPSQTITFNGTSYPIYFSFMPLQH